MRIGDSSGFAYIRQLNWRNDDLGARMFRLASGRRINSAADDAAGLAISARMRALARSTYAALKNIDAGLGFLRTADGALGEVSRLLQRGRELAIQSANGVWSDDQRASMQHELEGIRKAIDEVTAGARFNGRAVFSEYQSPYSLLRTEGFDGAAGLDSLSGLVLDAGRVRLQSSASTLFSESFSAVLPPGGSAWSAVASESPALSLSRERVTLATDTFANGSGLDPVSTAWLDSINQQIQLSAASVGYTLGPDPLTDSSNLTSVTGVSVSGGTATLATSNLGTVASESGAQVNFWGSDTFNAKVAGAQAGGAVLVSGASGSWNAYGPASSDVLYDAATGTYTMWFATGKNSTQNGAIGYATSTDGITWSAPTSATLGGGRGSLTPTTEISVQQEAGTYYMLYRSGGNVVYRTSTNGGTTWSREQTLVSGAGMTGRASFVKDAAGTFHLFVDTAAGVRQYTAASVTGAYTQTAGFLLAGARPEVVKEVDQAGGTVYSLYSKAAANDTFIKKVSSTDLLTWSAPVDVLSQADATGNTFDDASIRVGGVVFDAATGVSRMFYSGQQTGTSSYATGLAYVKAQTSAVYQSSVFTTASAVGTFQFNATAALPAGTTAAYEISVDGGSTWTSVTSGSTYTVATPGSQVQFRATLTNTTPATLPVIGPQTVNWSVDQIGYAGSGEVISKAWSFGGRSISNVTLNTAQTTPAGTGIDYYISADGATWQAVTPGVSAALGSPATSLYLKAVLHTADPNSAPVLDSYSLSTQARDYTSGQQVVSKDWTFANPVDRIGLAVNQLTPAGTGISYELSLDGGASWQAVTPGPSLVLGTPTTSVKLRATLSSSSPDLTPSLLDYTLQGERYVSSEQLLARTYSFASPTDTFRLDQVATVPAGGVINWEYSADGGATWTAFTAGTDVALAAPVSNLQLRSAFVRGAGGGTPVLNSFSLSALSTAQYAATGTYQSAAIDLGGPVSNLRLNVDSTLPAGTAIAYALSADGGATWLAMSPGIDLNFATPVSSVLLKANLFSTDPGLTPALRSWSLETHQYSASGELTSTVTNLAAPGARFLLDVAQSGSGIDYYLSNDGGATWLAAAPGQEVAFAGAGSQVQMRAVFTGGDPTASLSGYSLYQVMNVSPTDPELLRVQEGPAETNAFLFNLPHLNAAALGMDRAAIDTVEGAAQAVGTLDAAMRHLGAIRSDVGAAEIRLEHALGQRQYSYERMETDISRIADVDLAGEAMAMARAQLLLNKGSAVIYQGLDTRRTQIAALLKPLSPVTEAKPARAN